MFEISVAHRKTSGCLDNDSKDQISRFSITNACTEVESRPRNSVLEIRSEKIVDDITERRDHYHDILKTTQISPTSSTPNSSPTSSKKNSRLPSCSKSDPSILMRLVPKQVPSACHRLSMAT